MSWSPHHIECVRVALVEYFSYSDWRPICDYDKYMNLGTSTVRNYEEWLGNISGKTKFLARKWKWKQQQAAWRSQKVIATWVTAYNDIFIL